MNHVTKDYLAVALAECINEVKQIENMLKQCKHDAKFSKELRVELADYNQARIELRLIVRNAR